MQLKNLTNFPTDYLDAYCDSVVGHTNWSYVNSVHPDDVEDGEIKEVIVIYNNPDEEVS